MQFLHTMIRVVNLEKSLDFYTNVLGMKKISEFVSEEYRFTLVFVGFDEKGPMIELTHNWDTDSYELGNAFGHLALGSDDIYAACDRIKAAGGNVTREPGPMQGGTTHIAFVKDPDGYLIELVQSQK